ncbi:MAG: DUF4838 domain-containing protein [Marinilabiliaceae bacterium]|jgi:hypothetical protein|nr:DUF4838 domain-containing protein [Marinilabiliaceae bacterium]
MSRFLIPLIAAVLFLSSCGGDISLVRNSNSSYEILIANDPDSMIIHAAEELQKYLEIISGVNIPLVTINSENPGRAKILLGAYPEGDSYSRHNIFYRVEGGNLLIGGGSPLSSLYSVYTFLENQLGCKFLAPDTEIIPLKRAIKLEKDLAYNYTPAIETRTVHSRLFYDNHDFANKRKVSTEAFPAYVPEARVHTFHRFMPAAVFYNDHPEYYSLRNGRRLTTQLCLSNPDVLKIVSDSVKAHFDRNPGSGIISVSQDDNTLYCQCDECAAIDKEEGSSSGTMIRFVNEIARQFPGKTISTLAYQYTRKPCITRPEENVLVTLCSIECDRSKAIEDGCSDFAADLRGWKELSDNIRIWDYTTQFTNFLAPFPNIRTLGPNIRFFRDNNAKWVFEQHSNNPSELFELRSYLMAELLWNPDLDADNVITEFCNAYYGSAGSYVKEYIDAIHGELAKDKDFFLFLYGDPSQGFNSFLSAELLKKYDSLFTRAYETLIDNRELIPRIERAGLSIDYAILEASKKGMGIYKPDSSAKSRLMKFERICRENNITAMNEMRYTVDEYISSYNIALERSALANKASGADVVLLSRPHKYAGEDPTTLTDGALGGNNFYSGWLGFEGNDMEVVTDLGKEMKISSLNTAFLQVTNHIVFFPALVKVSYSTDNVLFNNIDLKLTSAPLGPDSKINDIEYYNFEFKALTARYIKLYAQNIKHAPGWHNASGLPAWIFCDEIIIN